MMMTADELARELQVSLRTLRSWNEEGRIPEPAKIGRAVRWPRETIVAWIAAGSPRRRDWEGRRNGR